MKEAAARIVVIPAARAADAPLHSSKKLLAALLSAVFRLLESITTPHNDAKVQWEANFSLLMPLIKAHLGPSKFPSQSLFV